MAAVSNVIEVVLKLRDEVTASLSKVRARLGGALAFGAGVVGVTSFASAIMKMVHATQEAQDALVKFDLAFKNLGKTSGKTREEMLRFADDASKTTIFDDESILRAQAALLKFQSVSGATFDRARQAAIDLASAIGTDLESATEIVGRALERPEVAIRQLRTAGVLFSADQEKMIRSLVKTGDRATAAEIILSRLEQQFRDAGKTAAGTLSGAIARTKTAFDNLFEGAPEDAKKMTSAFDSLAATLNSPEVKRGMAELIAGMAQLVSWTVQAVSWFGKLGKAIADSIVSPKVDTAIESLRKEVAKNEIILREAERSGVNTGIGSLDEQRAYIETLKQRIRLLQEAELVANRAGRNRRGGDRGQVQSELDTSVVTDGLEEIEEVAVKVFENSRGAMAEFYDSLDESTQTASERAGRAFEEIRESLNLLLNDKRISPEVYWARMKEAAEDGMEDVVVTVKKVAIEPIATAFDKLVDQFADAMERMLNNGKLSWRELGEYFLREVLTGFIKKAVDALAASLKKAFSGVSLSGGWGGLIAGIGKGISSLFGFASGGWGSGLAVVGEDGPEVVDLGAGSRVYNKRQMAFAGMGGWSTNVRQGDNNFYIQGSADEKTLMAAAEMMRLNNARQARELARTLEANGLRRPVR